jgi:apolipoprotein N-acyltransferase
MGQDKHDETPATGPARAMPPPGPRAGAMPTGNLSRLAGWQPTLACTVGALLSGALLTSAFPPLEWDWAAWFALVPILLAPVPATARRRSLAGLLFGLAHYLTNLFWLNEVGFGAGVLLALYCAVYPAVWYLGITEFALALGAARPGHQGRPAEVPAGWRQAGLILGGALLWVGLEWVRGWLFTGFPWNELGVSQWQRPLLLALSCFTGIGGITFLLVAENLALALIAVNWWRGVTQGTSRLAGRTPGLTVAAIVAVAALTARNAPRLEPPTGTLRVLVVQGNIPQCREWTQAQFTEALGVYTDLTRDVVPSSRPDLVVWPESAVPAPLTYEPFKTRLQQLLPEVQTPLLIGAIDSRALPGARWTGSDWEPPLLDFNSALLLAPDGRIVESYDKIHRVPFGEYVPFGSYLPWLGRWIGMGRDLVPGSEFTVFELGKGVRAGVNICFEDAFSDISREFVRRGANVLVTVTNDAWYAESAGSRQHLLHAVFRAAENRRPLLRSGNNSDTCLILPDGQVTGLLYDVQTGNRFVRGTQVYEIPIYAAPPLTVYARWGNWFSRAAAALAGLLVLGLLARVVRGRAARCLAVQTRSVA